MGIKYQIERKGDSECTVWVYGNEQKMRQLTPTVSQRIFNHSPLGFNYGYGGSGPAQLALALVFDVLGDRVLTLSCYQFFKWEVVAKWIEPRVWIESDEIRKWVAGWLQRQEDVVLVNCKPEGADSVDFTTVYTREVGELAGYDETLLYLRSACQSWPDVLERSMTFQCRDGTFVVKNGVGKEQQPVPRLYIARFDTPATREVISTILRK